MPLFALLFSIFLLRQGLSCLTNAPFYGDGGDDDDDDDEWEDDPVIPDWKLIKSDFSSIVIIMNSYTFTCSGRINEWYYWWILQNAVPNCEITFTPYVMRHQPSNGQMSICNATVVGYSRFVLTNARRDLYPSPSAVAPREEVGVKPGDFIAFQIELGNDCPGSTAVWLRGRKSSNTVFFKRRSETGLAIDLHAIAPFDVFHDVLPFISANVEPTSETTMNPPTMSGKQLMTKLTTETMTAPRSSSSSPARGHLPSCLTISSSESAAPHLATSTTAHSRRKIEVTLDTADIPITPSVTAVQISSPTIANATTSNATTMGLLTRAIPGTNAAVVTQTTPTTTTSATLPTIDTLLLAPPTATPTANSLSTLIIATADIQAPTSTNTASLTYITLDNILSLVIVGSLVVSVVLLGACLMVVTICACKRKSSSSTQQENGQQQQCDSTAIEAITSTSREATHEYDYININSETGSTVQDCVMEHNLAYNKSPAVFTTYI